MTEERQCRTGRRATKGARRRELRLAEVDERHGGVLKGHTVKRKA